MSDHRWPKPIRPLLNKDYSFNRGNGVFQSRVSGGLPRSARNLSLDTPTFNLNFALNRLQHQVITSFFNNQLNGGANTFYIDLDSSGSIEEHFGVIEENTWRISEPVDGIYYLSFRFTAESIPSQEVEDCPNLVDLYSCYGNDLPTILDNMDDLVENFL